MDDVATPTAQLCLFLNLAELGLAEGTPDEQ